MAVKRYPWAPLRHLIVLRVGARTTEQGVAFEQPGVPFIADMLGVDRKQIHRWASIGLDRWQADAAAVRAGLLPQLVWPEWMDDSMADLPLVVCAFDGCTEQFLPVCGQLYCSTRCRLNAKYQRLRVQRVEVSCEADGCTEQFLPWATVGPTRQRFCSRRCENRMTTRTYRATENGRLANRRANRKYQADVRAMKARRQQREDVA